MVLGLPGGIQAKATGLVFDSAHQPTLGTLWVDGKLHDYSRWKNHGTPTNVTVTTLPSGLAVATFAGDGYVDITGLTTDLSGGGDFTALIWVKFSGNKQYAFCQSHTLTPSYSSDWFFLQSAGPIFWMRNITLGTLSSIYNNVWHLLGMVWDLSAETYEGFVDGASIGTSDSVSGYGGVDSVKIGVKGNSITNFYTGSSARPRIILRALSAATILKHFTAERWWFGV